VKAKWQGENNNCSHHECTGVSDFVYADSCSQEMSQNIAITTVSHVLFEIWGIINFDFVLYVCEGVE